MDTYVRATRPDELYHYGVLGMKWGVRRYQNYDGTLKHPKGKKKLSAKTKRAIVNVAKAAAIGGAAYALYKTGALDNVVKAVGRNFTDNIIDMVGKRDVRDVIKSDILDAQQRMDDLKGQGPFAEGNAKRKPSGEALFDTTDIVKSAPDSFKRLSQPEGHVAALKNANPIQQKDPEAAKNNCVNAALAGYLRTQGLDVTALSSGGKQQIMGGVVEDVFKGVRVKDGYATTFGKSPQQAAEFLKKKFGDDAEGFVSIQWKNKSMGGHTFSYKIVDGEVEFMDFKYGKSNGDIFNYWNKIDPNDSLTICDVKGCAVNWDNVKKHVG